MPGETARDQRRTTLLKAHIRSDDGWCDALVCNVSAHGMMLQGEGLPPRGSFIEICGETLSLAGQVRWSAGDRCGVRTREAINLADLLGDHHAPEAAPAPRGQVVRVRFATPDDTALRAGLAARLLDFALVAAFVAGSAWLMAEGVSGFLRDPLERIGSGLGHPPR